MLTQSFFQLQVTIEIESADLKAARVTSRLQDLDTQLYNAFFIISVFNALLIIYVVFGYGQSNLLMMCTNSLKDSYLP